VKGLGNLLHRNSLLKHAIEEKIGNTGDEEEEEEVSSYWITLRKRKETGTSKREH
jgi:hypothetical protein